MWNEDYKFGLCDGIMGTWTISLTIFTILCLLAGWAAQDDEISDYSYFKLSNLVEARKQDNLPMPGAYYDALDDGKVTNAEFKLIKSEVEKLDEQLELERFRNKLVNPKSEE